MQQSVDWLTTLTHTNTPQRNPIHPMFRKTTAPYLFFIRRFICVTFGASALGSSARASWGSSCSMPSRTPCSLLRFSCRGTRRRRKTGWASKSPLHPCMMCECHVETFKSTCVYLWRTLVWWVDDRSCSQTCYIIRYILIVLIYGFMNGFS